MPLIAIDNSPVSAAWAATGGISELLGRGPSDDLEAELWLGSHHRSPSRVTEPGAEWADLAQWEEATGRRLPFLLKILDAATPLSLQAHPTAEQAQAGYQRENAAGIPLEAGHRNYRDPRGKPEMIVALRDGFEALCGFRDLAEVQGMLGRVGQRLDRAGLESSAVRQWQDRLGAQGMRDAVGWLLSGDPGTAGLIAELEAAALYCPEDLALVPRLMEGYPGDPGVAVALLMEYTVLARGEALWLPPGTFHAYLSGTGVELMGPSDNVLRGGLTQKHVDVDELLAVLDCTPGASYRLRPEHVGAVVSSYRTVQGAQERGADFELLAVTGDAAITTAGPSVVAVLEGTVEIREGSSAAPRQVCRGSFLFQTEAGRVELTGQGQTFIATPRRT